MNNTNSAWYKSLKQSPLTPPSWIFPIVWPILYIMIIASGIIFLKNGGSIHSVGFLYYCGAWILNISWSQIFFKYERPDLSFIIIIGMLAFIILNVYAFYPINRLAAYLLVPYLVWVSFATYLNGYIVFKNPKHRPEN